MGSEGEHRQMLLFLKIIAWILATPLCMWATTNQRGYLKLVLVGIHFIHKPSGPILHPFRSHHTPGGGGHSNNSVVHMRNQRTWKNGCFFRLKAIHANHVYGLKFAYFWEKGSFWIQPRGVWWSFFKFHQIYPSKKACLGVNLGEKSHEILV